MRDPILIHTLHSNTHMEKTLIWGLWCLLWFAVNFFFCVFCLHGFNLNLQEGTSNYFKGLMLILCYIIVAASFFVHRDPKAIRELSPPFPSSGQSIIYLISIRFRVLKVSSHFVWRLLLQLRRCGNAISWYIFCSECIFILQYFHFEGLFCCLHIQYNGEQTEFISYLQNISLPSMFLTYDFMHISAGDKPQKPKQ